MNATSDDKTDEVTNSRGTRSEKFTGAAIKLVRNVPGLKQSVLSGVAFLTRHETGYLHAKLRKEEEVNLELTRKCDELTALVASVGKHVESEKSLNHYIKTEAAAVRRMMFVEEQHKKVERNFPKYARYLPDAQPLDTKLTAALNEKIAPVIVFTHIQKTAGNSVIAFLQRCLSTPRVARIHELEMASRETIKSAIDSKFGLYDVMSGHIPFSRRIDLLLDRPNVNISIMREPVDRVVSLYFYLKANESWLDQGKYITQNKLSLLEFASSEAYFDNHMVRMLCDLEPTLVPIGQCSEEMLEQAKINIVKNFLLVGLTEKIDEFLEVLAHVFCWSLEDVPRENVNELRSPISKFPKEVLDVVAERNKYDVALYEFAKEYWEKTTESFFESRI